MRPIIIILLVFILPIISSSEKSTSIFDLLSWNLEDNVEVGKREESSNTDNIQTCVCNGGPSCMCCVDFNITYIDLGGPGCVYMKYISQDEGIAVNVSYGKSLLHSQQVKGPNPEPICMSLLDNVAQVCAHFSNLQPVVDGLKGCLQLKPKLFGELQTQFNIGCFTIGPDGMKYDTTLNITEMSRPLPANELANYNETNSEGFNEDDLIATVSETAEQSLLFFTNWLGLFDKPINDSTNITDKVPSPDAAEVSQSSPDT